MVSKLMIYDDHHSSLFFQWRTLATTKQGDQSIFFMFKGKGKGKGKEEEEERVKAI